MFTILRLIAGKTANISCDIKLTVAAKLAKTKQRSLQTENHLIQIRSVFFLLKYCFSKNTIQHSFVAMQCDVAAKKNVEIALEPSAA